jgi:hypothetical protein
LPVFFQNGRLELKTREEINDEFLSARTSPQAWWQHQQDNEVTQRAECSQHRCDSQV